MSTTSPIKIAIMGCVVNGPGEAREADIGIAGGDGTGILFRKGKVVKKFPQEESDSAHYLETEAIMKALARKFGDDEVYWGMIGLLHDVDWALTRDNWEEHCIKAVDMLKEKGFDIPDYPEEPKTPEEKALQKRFAVVLGLLEHYPVVIVNIPEEYNHLGRHKVKKILKNLTLV